MRLGTVQHLLRRVLEGASDSAAAVRTQVPLQVHETVAQDAEFLPLVQVRPESVLFPESRGSELRRASGKADSVGRVGPGAPEKRARLRFADFH